MIILINKATRLSSWFMSRDKEYIASLELGTTTDTWDLEGKVLSRRKIPEISIGNLKEILDKYKGCFYQKPPVFSAIKLKGTPSYKYARKGMAMDMEKRPVNINEIEILDFKNAILVLKISCSSGTYIRSLANDIGAELKCGASLKALKRTRIGDYILEDSISTSGCDLPILLKGGLEKKGFMFGLNDLIGGKNTVTAKDDYIKDILNGCRLNEVMINDGDISNFKKLKNNELVMVRNSGGRELAIHKILGGIYSIGSTNRRSKTTKSIVIFK